MTSLALGVCAALGYFSFRAASEIIENDAKRTVDAVADSQKALLEHTLTAQFERLHSTADNMAACSSSACLRASAERLFAREEPDAIRIEKPGAPVLEFGNWSDVGPLPAPAPHVVARPFRDRKDASRYVMTRVASDGTALSVVWSAKQLEPLFSHVSALGTSGQTLLADAHGHVVASSRHDAEQMVDVAPMRTCLAGEDDAVEGIDRRGVPVIQGYRHIDQIGGGCVLAHIDRYEAEAPVRKLEREILAASALSALVAIAVAALSSARLTHVIVTLGGYASRLRAGDLAAPVPVVRGTKEHEALAATLASMAKELEEVETVRERMIGILAHDLQSPLSAIVLSSSVIDRSDPPPQTRALVKTITSNAKRMSRMISGLLDFARSRRPEGLPVRKEDVDLGQLATSAIETLRAAHPHRAIDLRCEGDVHARCDPDRLHQVVINLVENALRYGADEAITVTVRGDADEIALSVRNAGVPIEPGDLANLFDAFHRGRDASQQARGGLGLGLYIVDQVLRAHGGSVDVASDPEGTTFTTHWPR